MEQFDKLDEDISTRSSPPHSQSPRPAISGAPGHGAVASDQTALQAGQIVEGRYKVLSFIGRGAVGSVYKVEQISLRKIFALKVLNAAALNDVSVRRFQKEAQAASRLDHANLVRAVDCGMIDETQPFLVMDFVEGITLADHLKKNGSLSVETALQIFIPVCFALDYAHKEGVIHRDIKPSNILLVSSGTDKPGVVPKVVDFGIAKMEAEVGTEGLTKTGEVFGTPLYMSPEQCSGLAVDNRSDIYALGCVLFESLTGGPPFRGPSVLELMCQHGTAFAPSLKEASLGLEFPKALETIVGKMLAKDATQRYQSCLKVAEDLTWLQQGQHDRIQVKRGHTATVGQSSSPKFKTIAISAALAVGIICGIAGARLWFTAKNIAPQSARVNTVDQPSTLGVDLNLVNDLAPDKDYSSIVHNARLFSFPAKVSLGELRWWDKDHKLQWKNATGKITVPLTAKIILSVGPGPIIEDPSLLTHFQDGDLSAAILKPGITVDADPSNRALQYLIHGKSLRMVLTRDITLESSTLQQIDSLPELRWLCLDSPYQSAKAIAKMQCLPRLRVLKICEVKDASPIIKSLAKSRQIARLSMQRDKLTGADLSTIATMHGLTHLDLLDNRFANENATKRERLFDELSKLPNLKALAVEGSLCRTNSVLLAQSLQHLKKLEILVINTEKQVDFEKLRFNLPAGCKIVRADQRVSADQPVMGNQLDAPIYRAVVNDWFEPYAEDPQLNHLWDASKSR